MRPGRERIRGFEEAYHTDLRPAWPTPYWTVPPWGQSWRSLSALAGGGTAWNPATIDPSTDIAYFSVAAPSPQYVPQLRPGPDPRSNSIVAVDVFTGRQLWWQQQLGADSWSYGTSQPPLLYEGNVLGRRRRIVSVATKEGVWFAYDARTGQPIYQRVNLLNQNLAQKSITVTVTDEAKKWILNQTLGDRSYGARPLRRALQKYIEDPLSEALIQGTITTRPAFIEVFLDGEKLYYRPVDSEKTEGVLLYEN